jgi:hypothetical protein
MVNQIDLFVRQRHKLLCIILGACDNAHPLFKICRYSTCAVNQLHQHLQCSLINIIPIPLEIQSKNNWMDQEHDCGFNNYNIMITTYGSIYGCFQHCLGLSSRSDPCTYIYSATPFKHSHINKPLTMHGPRLCFRLVFNNEHIPPQPVAVLYSL